MSKTSEFYSKNKTFANGMAVAGAVVAISSALTVFGLDVPRPAWSSELQMIEQQLISLENSVVTQQLDGTTFRLYRNLGEQEKYKKDSIPVPDILLKEQTELERKKKALEYRLDKIYESVK